jgi:6-phosphogluconate dehydrogenase
LNRGISSSTGGIPTTGIPYAARRRSLEERGLGYIGAGFCGGEEGTLTGPAIMAGGSPGAWSAVKPIFQAIAAKAGDGTPCCDWVGENGAGHFVKMVHSGIEYGDMQLICEVYDIMRTSWGSPTKR